MRVKLDPGAYAPERAYYTDAGLDLRTPYTLIVPARGSALVDTGVHIELPPGTAGIIEPKSGLNVNKNIIAHGVIDVGYTGSIVVKLYNMGDEPVMFEKGDKITQLVIDCIYTPPIEVCDSIDGGERGDNGFGSSGK